MKHCQPDGIRRTALLLALGATVFFAACAERKSEPAAAGTDAALTGTVAQAIASSTPGVANPANSSASNAADETVGAPESARPDDAWTQSPAPPKPARPHSAATPKPESARGIAVGEPDPTHATPAAADPRDHVQRDSGNSTGKTSVGADCRTDSDCAIKDVGSCCGYRPQCMNKNTPTFPEQVKARCGQEGRVSICGFPAITGCQCVAGKCAGITLSDDSTQVQ